MSDSVASERLSERLLGRSDRQNTNLARTLGADGLLPRLAGFLEAHHTEEQREHEGCEACILINHIDVRLDQMRELEG